MGEVMNLHLRDAVMGEVFFFSSRRRHTIFDCDWSSDVCSSDLVAVARGSAELERLRALEADVQFGARRIDPEQRERLRQFLAGRGEIVAGDRLQVRRTAGWGRV